MSSSNRLPGPSDATVFRNATPIGPLRLPRIKQGKFIDEFNRVYHTTGIQIQRAQGDATESDGTAEDSIN